MKSHLRATVSGRDFAIVSSAACMPSSCWGTYRRVALIELVPGAPLPRMITARSKNVIAVHETWERLRDGSTARCAFRRALKDADARITDFGDLA